MAEDERNRAEDRFDADDDQGAEHARNRASEPIDFDDDGFFEPTIEESVMASGLHRQFVVDE